jgi:alanyl-tRNA synthetase
MLPTQISGTAARHPSRVKIYMMTSSQIRQSFLDFFKSKSHTIVPSSSLMPDSPNLLFTNAGMNQFVPIFLGQVKCPYIPGRAADTQKCIRAGGKHNDLDDVGLDTYHHTFFEMLGNWSFGDYFKKEAIDWAWELVVTIWKFPPQRLYATVYNPDKSKNDPSEFDQEAWNYWAEKFCSVGLDPAVHIVNGNKKDNFWMMGDTGPCGPCSELHVDLTPNGDTKGLLVNKGDARCIEIWNLVFIQFNANPGGTFSPLPAKHVDTGMGFERVTSIIQGTKGFSDFQNAKISNYETDIFRPIFDVLEKLSGKKYTSTLPGSAGVSPASTGNIPDVPLKTSGEAPSDILEVEKGGNEPHPGPASDDKNSPGASSLKPNAQQIQIDIAFRVIADHIRTLSFAIADGIPPGNNDRNYVLRRILRRAVRYGRTLGFHEPFFYKLVDVLAETMGDVFPEIRAKKKQVQETIQREEEAFNKTLDRGIELFEDAEDCAILKAVGAKGFSTDEYALRFPNAPRPTGITTIPILVLEDGTTLDVPLTGRRKIFPDLIKRAKFTPVISAEDAFQLYDTYGFPLDLTELMARERGLTVDKEGFEKLMEEQRERARAAQKKTIITISDENLTREPTKFLGYERLISEALVAGLDVEEISVATKDSSQPDLVFRQPDGSLMVIECKIVFDQTPLYAEMGGQVGDKGIIRVPHHGQAEAGRFRVFDVQKKGNVFIHRARLIEGRAPNPGEIVEVEVDKDRRNAIQRHHTVTHLLHWALHEVVSKEASQKGSFVGPDKLTFDFNSQPLTPAQVADIEKLVNERIVENAGVSWTEVPYAEVKSRKDVMQFFGDKYGDTVRVVQIGGEAKKLNGYSMELCGGTHTRATGEIGLFRITGENAIAAGLRRIEAIAGLQAYDVANEQLQLIKSIAGKINSPVHELEKKIDAVLAHQKELEKQLKSAQQREAIARAKGLVAKAETFAGVPAIITTIVDADGDSLQIINDVLKTHFNGVIVLAGVANGAVAFVASVSPEFTAKVQAGKIIQQIAPIVGGKGGGKPDNARGGGKDAGKLDEALAKAKSLLG